MLSDWNGDSPEINSIMIHPKLHMLNGDPKINDVRTQAIMCFAGVKRFGCVGILDGRPIIAGRQYEFRSTIVSTLDVESGLPRNQHTRDTTSPR